MQKAADILFEYDIEHDVLIAKQLGRFQIGHHIGRLILCPDGDTRLVIDEDAGKDGSIVFRKKGVPYLHNEGLRRIG